MINRNKGLKFESRNKQIINPLIFRNHENNYQKHPGEQSNS